MIFLYGYKINFEGLPETVFACATSVNDYEWKNNNGKNVIEIGITTSEQTTFSIKKQQFTLPGTKLSCLAGDEDRKAYSPKDTENKITSVAVRFNKITASLCDLNKDDTYDNSVFLLPAVTTEIPGIDDVSRLLKKYIKNYVSKASYSRALCISVWFDILATIDKNTRLHLTNQKLNTENYYINKLNFIIKTQFQKKLLLTDIAKEFGVSMSYLSAIYSKNTGKSFRNAVLEMRMLKAKELISKGNTFIDDVAFAVGFCDVSAFRKSFKKFFGVNISELKNIENGMTLYHDKPLRKEKQ